MKKTLYVCGNSYSAGNYMHTDEEGKRVPRLNVPYGKIIADKIDFELVMLARAGASNYFTCKQVEYAIENHADLIIINFASPRHFDFTSPENKLTQLPKLSNFEYNERTWCDGLQNPAKNEIDHEMIKCLRFTLLEIYKNTTNPEYEILTKYLDTYNDYFLRIDQERLMILGLMQELASSGIKYVVTDFIGLSSDLNNTANPKELSDINILNYMKVEPLVGFPSSFVKEYPNPTDNFHFNQEGNHVVAERLLPIIEKLISD